MPSSPSVVVRVLGDLTGLSKSMDTTAKKSETVSKSISNNFSTMFSTLNTTGILGPFDQIFNSIQQGFDQIEEGGHRVSSMLVGIGVAATGAGALLTQLGSADQAAQQQLAQAIDNTGNSWSDYKDRVEAAISSQAHFGNSAVETQNALQVLTQATNDPTEALHLLSLATDLAASKHETLSEASTQLARILNGNTRVLKEFGIEMPKVGSAAGDFATQADEVNSAVTQLSAKLKGQATAAADTFGGHVRALKTEAENAAAAFGQKYGPALTAVGATVTVLSEGFKTATAISEAYRKSQEAQAAAAKVAALATETQTVATAELTGAEIGADAAGAPLILIIGAIVLAVGALIAIGYEIGTHWKAIWAGIKAAVVDVWDWVKQNWPLLLGIITGPIGLAVALIVKYRDQIWDGLKAVWSWLQSEWSQVYHFLVDPITNAAHAIVAVFKAAFNSVADLWNGTVGALSFKIPGWVPFIGGDKFSVPDIPHLAQGGLITQTGLIFAHAGEAITPAPVGMGGPAVNIENAQFNEPIDLDLLIKRVEFALSAGLPV